MRMSQAPFAAVVGAVTLVTALSTARAEKTKVGIAVAVKVNVSDIEARILSDSLGGALREKFDVEVVAGEDADRKLPEGGLPETCIAETECLRTTAESLGVDTLLVLVAVRVGDSVQVDATLFDAATGNSNTRPSVRMTDRERQWREAFLNSADDILPGAPRRVTTGNTGGNIGDNGGANNGGGTVTAEAGFIATRRTAGWVFGGLTVASATVLAVAGFRALDRCDSGGIFSSCTSETVANLALGATVISGGLFIYYFFVTEKEPSSNVERSIGLQPGPGDVGLAVGGRF
jgi:hypothetical protein